ncbi:MAG TPA: hypothetical protein VND93_07280 [Myxococcales bacterium]|nr:hypothetical protein [Myxococcales bacterium]
MPPDLVDQLRAGETPVGAGRFRIDSARALEKLRQFRLADPHHYVLELIRAAVASRARWVTVRTDADDFELSFDGEPFTPTHLEELLAQALMGGDDRDAVRGRLLSLGVAGALALDPRWVRVQSGGIQVELDASARATVTRAPPVKARAVTTLHVRDRLSWRVARDAVLGSREAKVIAELCRELPVPITLNDKPLGAGHSFAEPYLARVQREQDGVRLWAAFPRRPLEHSLVRFHLFGVQICERRWERLRTPIIATVHDDQLQRNASGSDVVETDVRYLRALAALEELVEPLLAAVAQRLRASHDPAARELLLAAAPGATGKLRGVIESAPLLPGPAGEWFSVADLRKEHSEGRPLRYATRPYPSGSYTRPVLLLDSDPRVLQLLPGRPRVDVAEEVALREKALEQRSRWESQEGEELRLPAGGYLVRAPVRGRGFSGEVGLLARPGQRPTVRVLLDRKLLFVESPDWLPPGTVAVVNQATPTPMLTAWAKPQAGITLRRFLPAIRAALASAAAQRISGLPDFPAELRSPARWLVAHALSTARSEEALALPGELLRAPLYDLAGGGHASLEALLGWPVIRHVEQPWKHPLLGGEPAVMLAPRSEAAELQRLLGEDRLQDVTPLLRAEARVRERMAAGPEPVRCRGATLVLVPVEGGAFRGEVGLLQDGGQGIDLRLYCRGILAEEVSLSAHYGPASAAIASDAFTVQEGWASVARDEAFDQAVALVRQGERALMEPLLHRYAALELPRWPVAARRYFHTFGHRELSGLLSRKALDPPADAAAGARVIPTSQGPRSLRDLAQATGEGGRLWLAAGRDQEVPPDLLVAYAEPALGTLLKAVTRAPEGDLAGELERRRARAAFQARPPRPVAVVPSLPLIVPVQTEEGLVGQVGAPARHVGTQVELSLGGRPLRGQYQETVLGMDAAIDLPEGSADPAEPLSPLVEHAVAGAVEEAELRIFERATELAAEHGDHPAAHAITCIGLGSNLDARLPHDRRQVLLDRPLVPTGDGQWLPVSHFDEVRRVGYVTRPVNGAPRSGPVVLAADPDVVLMLARWRSTDVTFQVEKELAVRAHRQAIPRQSAFAYAGRSPWRFPLEGTPARGEVALVGGRTGTLELYHQGRPLCLVREEALPACAAVVVNDDRLTPTGDETGVMHDRAYHALVRELMVQLDASARRLAEQWPSLPEDGKAELRPLALQLAVWQARRKQDRAPLREVPLLEASDGSPMALSALLEAVADGRRVPWSSVPGAPLDPARQIWRPRPGERPLLAELQLHLEDASAEVRAAEDRRRQAQRETYRVQLDSPFRVPIPAPRRGEAVLPQEEPQGRLQLYLLKDGILLETVVIEHPVGAVVRVEDPALAATKGWKKAARNAAYRAMREAVELAVERAVVQRLASPLPGRMAYARAALRWRSGSAGPLAEALPALELFRDAGGRPVRLGEVMAEVSRRGAVAVLDRSLAAAAPEERLVLARDDESLALLADLQLRADDLTPDVQAARALEASRAARKLQSLRYGGEALVRLEVDRPDGFRGELALPLDLAQPHAVVLARDGIAVTEWMFSATGVAGVLEHPALAVDATWRGAELTAEQRKDLLEEVDALYTRLAGVSPAFEPAQRAAAAVHVLRYLKDAGMRDATQLDRLKEVAQRLADAPVLRAAEGRWVGVRTAAAQALRRNGLAVLGARVATPSELAVVTDSLEIEGLLGEVLGWKRVQVIRDLEAWKEAQARAEPEEDTPLARGLDRLRREATLLRADALGRLTTQELAQIRLHRRGGKGAPIRYREDRREASLDPDHPLVRGALEAADARPEGIYVLLASIYGAVNRALERVTDEDEARMLGALTRHLAANPELLEPRAPLGRRA